MLFWSSTIPNSPQGSLERTHPNALDVLERGIESKDQRVALQSAQALLDRALGKPAQAVDVKAEAYDASQDHLAAIIAIAACVGMDVSGCHRISSISVGGREAEA